MMWLAVFSVLCSVHLYTCAQGPMVTFIETNNATATIPAIMLPNVTVNDFFFKYSSNRSVANYELSVDFVTTASTPVNVYGAGCGLPDHSLVFQRTVETETCTATVGNCSLLLRPCVSIGGTNFQDWYISVEATTEAQNISITVTEIPTITPIELLYSDNETDPAQITAITESTVLGFGQLQSGDILGYLMERLSSPSADPINLKFGPDPNFGCLTSTPCSIDTDAFCYEDVVTGCTSSASIDADYYLAIEVPNEAAVNLDIALYSSKIVGVGNSSDAADVEILTTPEQLLSFSANGGSKKYYELEDPSQYYTLVLDVQDIQSAQFMAVYIKQVDSKSEYPAGESCQEYSTVLSAASLSPIYYSPCDTLASNRALSIVFQPLGSVGEQVQVDFQYSIENITINEVTLGGDFSRADVDPSILDFVISTDSALSYDTAVALEVTITTNGPFTLNAKRDCPPRDQVDSNTYSRSVSSSEIFYIGLDCNTPLSAPGNLYISLVIPSSISALTISFDVVEATSLDNLDRVHAWLEPDARPQAFYFSQSAGAFDHWNIYVSPEAPPATLQLSMTAFDGPISDFEGCSDNNAFHTVSGTVSTGEFNFSTSGVTSFLCIPTSERRYLLFQYNSGTIENLLLHESNSAVGQPITDTVISNFNINSGENELLVFTSDLESIVVTVTGTGSEYTITLLNDETCDSSPVTCTIDEPCYATALNAEQGYQGQWYVLVDNVGGSTLSISVDLSLNTDNCAFFNSSEGEFCSENIPTGNQYLRYPTTQSDWEYEAELNTNAIISSNSTECFIAMRTLSCLLTYPLCDTSSGFRNLDVASICDACLNATAVCSNDTSCFSSCTDIVGFDCEPESDSSDTNENDGTSDDDGKDSAGAVLQNLLNLFMW